MDILAQIGSGVTAVIGWIGQFVNALVTTDGSLNALLGFVVISCAVSAVMLGIRVVRGLIWGA